jgi:NTP pyrophosphatase (non-canonical NTP hydrolase)
MDHMGDISSFSELQVITAVWREYNFPNYTASEQFEGIVEEVGELAHAKRNASRGIRGEENHRLNEMDAVGDLIIYLCGYCTKRGLSLAECITLAWEETKDRDWIKYPGTGRPPTDEQGGTPPSQPKPVDLGVPESDIRRDERSLD